MVDARDLLLTGSDPWCAPRGGQAAFARHLLAAYGRQLAVSSFCNDRQVPTGRWVYRRYKDQSLWFFSRGPGPATADRKPLVPARLTSYLRARRHIRAIRKGCPGNLITDCPELLFAASHVNWDSVCYRFAGVNNPISVSRYPWARFLGRVFERHMIGVLDEVNPDAMLGSADDAAIDEFFERTGHILDRSRFHQFPTRVDTELFRPIDPSDARRSLGLPPASSVFTTTGRLCWIKGWDLLLEAFTRLQTDLECALLIFVGDGEDHAKLLSRAHDLGISDKVRVTGFVSQDVVVDYMNAADVCLMGSHREGWSLAMCEMIACGKPIVSTEVSGADSMIRDGENGFVVKSRDPEAYSAAVLRAMNLQGASAISLKASERYAVSNLARELDSLWSRPGCRAAEG